MFQIKYSQYGILKSVFILIFIVFSSVATYAQQYSTVNVDSLTDAQVMDYLKRAQDAGYTIDQAEQIAVKNGFSPDDVKKFKKRVDVLKSNDVQTAPEKVQNIGADNSSNTNASYDVNKQKATTVKTKELEALPITVYGQSFFRNANLSIFEKSLDAKAPENYVIGIGDELGISVFGFSYYNEALKVDSRGGVNLKNVGSVYVKGLTFSEAKELLKAKLKQYYDAANNHFEITLAYSRSITVNIVGEVINPGSYKIPAVNTAFNALIAAGGPSDIGSVRQVQVRRAGRVVKVLDVYKFLNDPSSENDFFLEDNDYVVVVPSSKLIRISGEIRRPLMYELLPNENLGSLIKYAGGLNPGAYLRDIQITRYDVNNNIMISVNWDSLNALSQDFPLINGDKIVVKALNNEYENKVEVNGYVQFPGFYDLRPSDKVLDLINKAGGLRYESILERAFLIRTNKDLNNEYIPLDLSAIVNNPNNPNNYTLRKNDKLVIFSYGDFSDKFSVGINGEVRKPGNFDFSDGMTLGDVLFLSGGLKSGADISHIDISRLNIFSDSFKSGNVSRTDLETLSLAKDSIVRNRQLLEYKLKPFDIISVRQIPDFKYQELVLLKGEVKYPGEYVINVKNETIVDLIKQAGGLSSYAFPEGSTYYRPSVAGGYLVFNLPSALKNYSSGYNYHLKEGDIITIPTALDFIEIKGSSNQLLEVVNLPQVNAPYVVNKRANYYIKSFANGFSKDAWKKKTYVVYPNTKINRTKSFLGLKVYPKVRRGSTIYIVDKKQKEKNKKERTPVDWNKTISDFTVKLTALATLYVLLSGIK